MGNLRRNFERFCYRHRNKGISNLMLYITIGSAIVYLLSMVTTNNVLYTWLCFDKAAILRGQVWRLLSYVFTYSPGNNPFLILIGLYFFYHLSSHMESVMGTFKFNLFYFSGVLLMDVFAMIFCPTSGIIIVGNKYYLAAGLYAEMALYLHLSITLMFSVTNPDAQFLVFFIIPVKAWFIAMIDLVLISISIYQLSAFFPHNLFPLVGLLNFLLFAGKDVVNLFPFLRGIRRRSPAQKQKATGSVPFPGQKSDAPQKSASYTHRCVICGRTDTSNPELEFRYCSRCKGYFCYCQDHINSHTHIEE